MVKFGTGGWRAAIGDEFIKDNILLVAESLGRKIEKENKKEQGVVIGYDRRFLSDSGARWIATHLAKKDIKVYLVDKVSPTPLIMFTVNSLGCPYGVAVTASHNPAADNGIKIFTEGGRDASVEVTNELESIMEGIKEIDKDTSAYNELVENKKIEIIDPFNAYIDNILAKINIDAIKQRPMKILLDPMYGVSKTSLQTILLTARCDIDLIHDRHDTLFGGRLPSPSAETLKTLKYSVLEKGYDLGIGTDGDADRLGVIDEKGRFIHPNEIMALLYYYLLEHKGWKGPIVRNLSTTHLLDAIAKDHGEVCYEVPVGFKHISSKMEETDAIIGGESSGGLTIAGHIKGKDGIFAASLLIEMIAVTGRSLSEMLDEIYGRYGNYEMIEAAFRFSVSEKERLLRCLYEEKRLPTFNQLVERISYEDGIKVYFENGGWIVIRFSGTEPLLRMACEMESKEKARTLIDEVKEFLNLTEEV